MNPEDVIKKRIGRKKSFEDAKLLEAVRSMTSIRTKELDQASTLLAEKTEKSADELAKKTEKSAEDLARTTEKSAEQLSKNNEISVRWMKWLTLVLIAVGLVQIALAIVTLLVTMRLK